MKTFKTIDVAKFIFACLIFIMHSGVLFNIPNADIIKPLFIHLGVLFFFATSGFLTGVKSKHQETINKDLLARYTRHQINRLFRKLLIFEPISIIIIGIE